MTQQLLYVPLRDGYQVQCSYPVISIALDGGPSRKRLDYLYAPHTVELNWLLKTPAEYSRFMGFFRTTLDQGTQAFLVDLIVDTGTEVPHRCHCLGGLPKLTQQKGHAFYVSATLEVEANPTFTGQILFDQTGSNAGTVQFSGMADVITTGDFIRILDSAAVHSDGDINLNFDGLYEVDSTSGSSILHLVDVDSVSSSWAVLEGLTPSGISDVIATVVRVPT